MEEQTKKTQSSAPIGIFDSGIGGLTVLKAMHERLPREDLIYIGDLGRSPYGTKSRETIQVYARQITRYLLSRRVKLIIIACNTASAAATWTVQDLAGPVPVLEVVGHGSRLALDDLGYLGDRESRIGVLGTRTTVTSDVYRDRLLSLAAERGMPPPLIQQKACPLFVPLVEEGLWRGQIPDLVAGLYLEEMKAFSPQVVILGCTHYPLLKETIAKALPAGTRLKDSAPSVAETAAEILEAEALLSDRERAGSLEFHCSDSEDTFRLQAGRFLDMPLDIVHHIDLDAWGN
ncbi:MAG: glutamate racemase [Clostridiaceae bacterium]|jgi:glutamate racemase|nr:glutamate racemase [Clostridiaceae bacterium]